MLLINQFKINTKSKNDKEDLIQNLSKFLSINPKEIIDFKIIKKSLDARYKPDLFWIYSLSFSLTDISLENKLLNKKKLSLSFYQEKSFDYIKLKNKPETSPVIIGSGPAGLFCALYLIKAGFKPLIIERGDEVAKRSQIVNDFWNGDILNLSTNVQFGEGGAGTFSDGKLNTAVKDKYGRIKEILKLFVSFGAPEEIVYQNKPHIGTDILKEVIVNIRKYLEANGATYLFNTCLTNINIENDKLKSIELTDANGNLTRMNCSKLVLAIGHSARDSFEMLNKNNVPMVNKAFAVGLRVMHNQELINNSQYGYDAKNLGAADYKLTYNKNNGRSIYSFCMCPGGYVVNASSENNRLCINGMSYSHRNSLTANSAIVVTIDENDYGYKLLDGMRFQRLLEERAYKINNGRITLQKLIDFKNNKASSDSGNTYVSLKGQYCFGNICSVFGDEINSDLIEAFSHFGKLIKGFDNDDAILCAVEARTSSPVKILRDDNCQSMIKGIYPCGEGAGYAGGISSAAADGLKVAESIVLDYNS